MRTLVSMLVLIIVVLMGLNACSKSDQVIDIKEDRFLTLEYGESSELVVNSERYHIEFLDVDDKRCLKKDCAVCYGSKAIATIKVSKGDSTKIVKLTHLGCVFRYSEKDVPHDLQRTNREDVFSAQVFDLNFGMLELGPYPESSYSQKNKYFVKLFIYR